MSTTAHGKASEAATVSSEEVRLTLGEIINRVKYRSERIRVTRRGKPVMALVPVEDLEFMENVLDALEDELDIPLIKERLHEYQETGFAIPWKQIKAERGL